MKHNQQLIDDIIDIENRFRRRDLLIDEHRIFEFYQERLPEIYDIRTLARFLKQKATTVFANGKGRPASIPRTIELDQYPNRLDIEPHALSAHIALIPERTMTVLP